jgi:hypothetical protein
MKKRINRIGKVERASGNKPRTIVDLKEVEMIPIVDPFTLKVIAYNTVVSNVSQNAEELKYVSNQSLPNFCSVNEKQILIDKFSLKIKVDRVNICGTLEIVGNTLVNSVPIFKSEYYQLLTEDVDTLIGYRLVRTEISREVAKKIALPNYHLYPLEINTKKLETADVFLSLNFFGNVDGIKYVSDTVTSFIKNKSLVEIAKAKVEIMKIKLNLTGKAEFDETAEQESFNNFSKVPEDTVDSFFITESKLENYFSVNPRLKYNFLIKKAYSEKLLLIAGILNLYQCPGVFNSYSSNSSNIYKTYSNESLLPVYYYSCFSKYLNYSFRSMFNSLNYSDFPVKKINSSRSSTCVDENFNNKVPIPKEIFEAIFKNYSKEEEKKDTKKEEKIKMNSLVEQILADLAVEKEKNKDKETNSSNASNNLSSNNFVTSTFKADFEKASDEEIFKYQNYIKEGLYVDANNNQDLHHRVQFYIQAS